MSKFIAQSAFLAAFLALPLLFLINLNIHGERSPQENRFLAKAPHLPKLKRSELTAFPKQCEEWLQDRVGFREKMVGLYSGFHYYILGTPPQKRVTVGRGSELFLSDLPSLHAEIFIPNNIRGFEQFLPPKNIEDSKLSQKLIALKSFTDNLGVPTKAVIIPQKPVLDFHNLPYYVRKFISTPPPPNLRCN